MSHTDPRVRRHRHEAPAVDALAAAVRLDLATQAMRERALEHGPDRDEDEPPTGLLDLAAIRAAVAAGPVGEAPDPAAVAWLAGGADPAAARMVRDVDALEVPAPRATVEPITAAEFAEALGPIPPEQPPPLPEPEPVPQPVVEVSPEPAPVAPVVPEVPAPAPVPVVPAAFVSEQPRPLHWRSRHDPRSLEYSVRGVLSGSAPLTDHLWPTGPVLDQGTEGECVGCGLVDAVNALRLTAGGPVLGIGDAAGLYHRAQQLDDIPGEDYTGTSVLAGMQAAAEAGLIAGYRWCFGTRDVAQAVLQAGPVVIGVPWLSGMYDTGPGGLVQVHGDPVGGHCLAVVGIRRRGPQGQDGPFFVWQNSWGPSYGDAGLGYIHHRELAGLLHGTGEAAVVALS